MELILLRGLPGAGKSSLASILAGENDAVFSVDDYFTDPLSGDYKFEFDKNHLAYKACEDNTRASMKARSSKIIVHNTFTMDWEMEPYFKMAAEHSYRVHVCTVENYHSSGNIHGVSEEQLRKMAEKYKVKLM